MHVAMRAPGAKALQVGRVGKISVAVERLVAISIDKGVI
jgi:hypothetical protein